MMYKIIVIILILIINRIESQLPDGYGFGLVDPSATCSSYIGDPIDQELCFNKLTNKKNIYSTNNKTNQIINLKIVESTFKQFTFLQAECGSLNYAEFGVCNIYVPPCVTVPIGGVNITLPQRLCKSVCSKMVEGCPKLGSSLNCSDAMTFPEIGTLYNLKSYGFNANNGLYPVPCTDPTSLYDTSPGQMIEICPSPLLLLNSSDPKYSPDRGYTYITPSNCVIGCPVPIYSHKKWNSMYIMSKVISTISLICSIYNIFTFGFLCKAKSKYNSCIVAFSASVTLMTLMDIVTYGIGYEKVLCPEPYRYAVQSDVSCAITGALFHFGITNGVLWWTTMSICLVAVVKRIHIFKFRYFVIFNSIVSLIMLIIPLSGKAIMAGADSIGCWIRITWFVNGAFWIPFGFLFIIGTSSIVLVIIEVYKVSKNVSKDRGTPLWVQVRPFLCVILVGGSFLYLFVFYFDNERNRENYHKNSVPAYIMCLLSGSEDCLIEGADYGAYFMFYFFIRFFGILAFLIYGTSRAARDIWIESYILNHSLIKPYLIKVLVFFGISNRYTNSSSSGQSKPHLNRNGSNFNVKPRNSNSNNNSNSDYDTISVKLEYNEQQVTQQEEQQEQVTQQQEQQIEVEVQNQETLEEYIEDEEPKVL